MKHVYRIALTLVAILLVAVVFAPIPGDTHWVRTLHNSAHAPIFGCIALLVLVMVRSHPRFESIGLAAQYAIALAAAFSLGLVTEILQRLIGRDASFEDAFHDALGILAFLGVYTAFDPRLRALSRANAIRSTAAILGIAALVGAAVPITRAAVEYQRRDSRFPILADFSRGYDRFFIEPQWAEFSPARLPAEWAIAPEETALRVRLLDGLFPGLNFFEVSPDWSAYSILAIDLTNPTSLPLKLVLRVHDALHDNTTADRFNRRIELPARTREVVRIPLEQIAAGPQTRTLDLRRVAGIIVFRPSDSLPANEIYFSRAWLE